MAQYEVTLRDYWRILRRRKAIVLFTSCLLAFFSYVMAHIWRPVPQYKASAKVQVNTQQTLTGIYLQTLNYGAGDQIETERAVITSFPVMKRTTERLGWFKQARSSEDTTGIVLDLQSRIDTRPEGFTNIIVIEATHEDRDLARILANTVAREYREYDREQKNQQAVKNRRFIEGQRRQARQALGEAEEAVRAYRQKTELISIDAQASVNLGQITSTEQKVQQLEQNVAAVASMLREMEKAKGVSEQTMQGAERAQVGESFIELSRQLNRLRLDRDALLVQYTESHPQVQQLQVNIDQLAGDLVEELRQRHATLQRDLETAKALLAGMRSEYNQLPSKGLQLSRLEREVSMRQEVVTGLEEQYQQALIREADKVEDVTILQRALTPTRPINPHHPLQQAGMGLVLGVILGVVFAVVAETLDTSIGTVEDVQEYTGAQVVGIIPYINVDEVASSLQRRGQSTGGEREMQHKAQLVAYFDPLSTLSETYRTLRTNIEFVTVEKGIKTLMVTSTMRREGKSTTIANLAMTMAQLGKRTLLVDCDLRKPTIARLFGLDKEPGLTEVIVGNYQWREVIRTVTDIVTGGMGMEDILQTQGISNLHIITSGAVPPNPAELLNSHQMETFIDEVAGSYDVVLCDSPPVLQVTDAAILGKKVDGTLMVYKAGDIPRTSLKRSTSLLHNVQIELIGVVLNGIRAELSSDFQDLGYYEYYGYGYEGKAEAPGWQERFQRLVQKWTRFGVERDGYEDEDYEEEEWEEEEEAAAAEEEEESPAGTGAAREKGRETTLASYVLLALAGLGLIWQSGYVAKPLGLLPVLAGYKAPAGEELPSTAGGESAPGRKAAAALQRSSTLEANRMPEKAPPQEQVQVASQSLSPPRAVPPPRVQAPAALQREEHPYTIRIASYPRAGKWALRMLHRLQEKGENAFLNPVYLKDQQLLRLLVGSFSSWDEAFAHAHNLQQENLIEEFTILRLPYAVEVQRFATRRQALEAAGRLKPSSRSIYVQSFADSSARLLAGAFATEDEAARFLARLPAAQESEKVALR